MFTCNLGDFDYLKIKVFVITDSIFFHLKNINVNNTMVMQFMWTLVPLEPFSTLLGCVCHCEVKTRRYKNKQTNSNSVSL